MRNNLVRFLWVIGYLLGFPVCVNADDQTDALRSIAEGYSHHRELLNPVRIEFFIRETKAASVEDAVAGKFASQEAPQIQGLLIVSGDKALSRRLADDRIADAMAEATSKADPEKKPGTHAMSSTSQSLLRKSEGIAVVFSPFLSAVNVHREPGNRMDISRTPFDLGIMGAGEEANPARLIEQGLLKEGGMSCKHLGNELINGASAEVIRISSPRNEAYTYYLDPARGFLPLRFTYDGANGHRFRDVRITEIVACPKDRWLPKRAVVVAIPESTNVPLGVSEYVVTKWELDRVPKDEEFVISVPEGTVVSDAQNAKLHYRLTSNTPFTFDMGEQFLNTGGIPTFTKTRHTLRWWLAGIVGGLVILSATVWVARRLRRFP